jgi:nicotinamidase-related amidase
MSLLDASRSTLLLIDLQGKLVHAVSRSSQVLDTSARLVRLADLFAVPVILSEQYPKGLGPTEPGLLQAVEALAAPALRLVKDSFSCCGDPAFAGLLERARPGLPPDRHQVVVAGIEAHVCVLQTVLELRTAGHPVHVCWDAVSGRGEEYRAHALERMAAAGAVLTNHESVGFEWARHKDHPSFKAMSAIFKTRNQTTG